MLKLSGRTIEGKLVIANIFQVTSTIGLPLEIIVDVLNKRDMIINWQDFLNCSIASGARLDTTLNKIENAIGDVFGSKYKEEVMSRLK